MYKSYEVFKTRKDVEERIEELSAMGLENDILVLYDERIMELDDIQQEPSTVQVDSENGLEETKRDIFSKVLDYIKGDDHLVSQLVEYGCEPNLIANIHHYLKDRNYVIVVPYNKELENIPVVDDNIIDSGSNTPQKIREMEIDKAESEKIEDERASNYFTHRINR